MARPSLPCETAGAHDTQILVVGAGFAGLAFARAVRLRAMRKNPDAVVTHIDVSDEGAVAAGGDTDAVGSRTGAGRKSRTGKGGAGRKSGATAGATAASDEMTPASGAGG